MKTSRVALALFIVQLIAVPLIAAQAQSPPAASSAQQQSPSSGATATIPSGKTAESGASRIITSYSLPPDLHKKAHDLNRIRFRLALIGFVYGIVVLWLVLRWRLAPKYREWSESFSSKSFLQSLVFSPLLLLTIAILTSPLDIYSEWIEKQYGLSVQGWGSWGWDWVKAELISLVIGTIVIWLLYLVIRKSVHRWWSYFWLITLPLGVFFFFCNRAPAKTSLPSACSGWGRAKKLPGSTPM